jgi:hypothetical protein
MSQDINEVLVERGNNYGQFPDHATLSQGLKRVMQDHPQYDDLPDPIKEALEMVQHKIARIINGDYTYLDSYVDIRGYTQLVEDYLRKRNE